MELSQQPELTWKKAQKSSQEGSNCVEVARLPDGGTAVRDSKDREGSVLQFSAGEWAAFLHGARGGEFD